MSDKKQVIHVKDLVIKADNIHIERPERHDPFFGPRRDDKLVEEKSDERDHKDEKEFKDEREYRRRDPFFGPRREIEDREEHDEEHDDKDEKRDDRKERRPFSWF